MINLLNKLLFLISLCSISLSLWGFNSSNFLISEFAFKNYEHSLSLSDFKENNPNLTQAQLTDKLIAAVIINDIDTANKISNRILSLETDNQEAYIVKLVYYFKNQKYNLIKELYENNETQNDLINFIFFNGSNLKTFDTISKSLIEIVVSSFSNIEERTLNYNFLLFYVSLAQIIDPSNDRSALIKGELYQNLQKDKIARSIFENIESNSPFYIEAQKSLAYNYSTFLPFEEAEKKILKLIDNTNNNYFIKKILGDFYRYNKKYQLAMTVYDELLNQSKNDLWNIYYMIGVCYERLDDWENAEKNFIISLEIKPDSPNVKNYLAYGWIERGMKLDKSLQMLEEAYAANPESFYIIDSLAWAHFKKNNLNKAARLMEKVIDIAPGEAISLDHLGDIYYAMNRKREAIHFWQQALELAEPDDEITEDVQSKLDNINAG